MGPSPLGPYAPSSSSGTLILCEFPVCLAEDLVILVPGITRGSDAGGRVKGEEEKDRGEVVGERAKGYTEHSRVGIDLLH